MSQFAVTLFDKKQVQGPWGPFKLHTRAMGASDRIVVSGYQPAQSRVNEISSSH
jgi:hypothetical protein